MKINYIQAVRAAILATEKEDSSNRNISADMERALNNIIEDFPDDSDVILQMDLPELGANGDNPLTERLIALRRYLDQLNISEGVEQAISVQQGKDMIFIVERHGGRSDHHWRVICETTIAEKAGSEFFKHAKTLRQGAIRLLINGIQVKSDGAPLLRRHW